MPIEDWETVEKPKTLEERIQRFYIEKNPMRILYEEQFTEEECKTSLFLEGMVKAYKGNTLAGDCRILLSRLLVLDSLYVEAVRYLLQDVGIRLDDKIAKNAMVKPRREYLELLQKFVQPVFKIIFTSENIKYFCNHPNYANNEKVFGIFRKPVCKIVSRTKRFLGFIELDIDETLCLFQESQQRKEEELKAIDERERWMIREQKDNAQIWRQKLGRDYTKDFEEWRKKDFEEYNEKRRKELELWNALQKPENGHILEVLKGLKIV